MNALEILGLLFIIIGFLTVPTVLMIMTIDYLNTKSNYYRDLAARLRKRGVSK